MTLTLSYLFLLLGFGPIIHDSIKNYRDGKPLDYLTDSRIDKLIGMTGANPFFTKLVWLGFCILVAYSIVNHG